MSHKCQVRAQFFAPPAELARYFTTFYLAEIEVEGEHRIADYLHPEWGNLRFASGQGMTAHNHLGEGVRNASFAVTGASSHAVRFEVGPCRIWGVGLLPLGWAKFVPAPAGDLANAVVDGTIHAAFASFWPLAGALFGETPDPQAELARITAHFMARLDTRLDAPIPDEKRITAVHAALVDPEVSSVTQLAERTGTSQRTVERICLHAFGFSPKLLLRRQRFIRSLAQYMLDPSLRWIGALDGHYHDQAQFVREFRQFMGMTPRDYARMDQPVLRAFVMERARKAGAPMQALDRPGGGLASFP